MGENQNIDNAEIGHIVTADELVMDEETIIREQERMANEKKKKKAKKRRKILFIIFVLLILGLIGYYLFAQKFLSKPVEAVIEMQSTEKQNITFVKVNKINGNEIDYVVLKAVGSSEDDNKSNGNEYSVENINTEKQPSGFGSGNRVESSRPSRDNNQWPSSDKADRPSGFHGGNNKSSGNGVLTYNGTTYELGEENVTRLIPVGTQVTTKLGTVTTFSRIAAGDCLAIVTEVIDGTEQIISVYIVG